MLQSKLISDMDQYQFILYLLAKTIHPELTIPYDKEQVKWEDIFPLLNRNSLSGVVCHTISNLKEELRPDKEMLSVWQNSIVRAGVKMEMSNRALVQVIREADARNISFLCFKGILLSSLYPENSIRFSCDADILVGEQDIERMRSCLRSLGYEQHEQKIHVDEFKKENVNKIELHTSLWEDFEGQAIERLEQMEIGEVKKRVYIPIGDVMVPTLPVMEHLLYLLFHFVKHLSTEGVSVKFLLDIVIYFNHFKNEIDFAKLHDKLKMIHYEYFVTVLLQIGKKYSLLEDGIFDMYAQGCKIIPLSEELEKDFLDVLFLDDKKDIEKWTTMYLMIPYFCDYRQLNSVKKSKLIMACSIRKSMYKKTIDLLMQGYMHDPFGDSEYTFQKGSKVPVKQRFKIAEIFLKNSSIKMKTRMDVAIDRLLLLKRLGLVCGKE